MHKMCKECANYDHKNLKHTKACGACVTERYEDGTESDPSNWRALPQTNADRIRAMSDRELAEFLTEKYVMASCLRLKDQGFEPTETEKNAIKHTLYCTWMKWLKQPAQEE